MNIIFRFIQYTLLLFAVTLIVSSCRHKTSDDDEGGSSEVKATVAVKTAKIVEADAIITVSAFGKTDALKKEKIYAPIAGRVTALKAYEGTEVKKGDLLALIQTKESQSAILGAESMLRTASTPEQKAEAERIVRLARSTQNSVSILARFDGFVSSRSASDGELVAENAELLTIIDLSTIDFVADVQLRDMASVRTNQRATIHFQSMPERYFPAIVDAINPQSDAQSQTVKIRFRFVSVNQEKQPTLRTDMMGTVSIVTGVRPHALFVPKAALLRNDEENSYSVVTITPDSLALRIPVTVGTVTDSTAEVRSPELKPTTVVITEGNYTLADSTRVTVLHQGQE